MKDSNCCAELKEVDSIRKIRIWNIVVHFPPRNTQSPRFNLREPGPAQSDKRNPRDHVSFRCC